jgi:pantetheine-phosphate adenylyltransferase
LKAIYAGSFDPITLGHLSVIERAFHMFETLHIVIANNRAKQHFFTLEQRKELVRVSVPGEYYNRAVIVPFQGVVADYINANGIDVVIRGIRNVTDLDYELQLEQYIRNTTHADTVYLSPYTPYMLTSSSLVRMFFQSDKLLIAHNYMPQPAYELAMTYIKERKSL